jgi:hypothetical protein
MPSGPFGEQVEQFMSPGGIVPWGNSTSVAPARRSSDAFRYRVRIRSMKFAPCHRINLVAP